MAKIKFLLQGLKETEDHYAELEQLLALSNINRCLISVAFINSTGAAMIAKMLEPLSTNLQFFIGIRNGVTSKQGIEILESQNIYPICVDTATQAFIFHPKVYLVHNQTTAKLITGSANFTSGGLIKNIEASIVANLDLSCQDDLLLLEKITNDFVTLKNQYPKNIFQLDSTFDLDEMVKQGLLVDETIRSYRASMQAQSSYRHIEQRPCMKANTRKLHYNKNTKVQTVTGISNTFSNSSIAPITNSQLLWKSGPLTRRDLNIPTGSNTHATGSMLLKVGDSSQKIDQRYYFRNVVFATALWKPDSNPQRSHIERCSVKFRIIIKSIDYGIYTLKLSHNTRTNTKTYNQNNSMTQIHWGETVKPMIAHQDLLNGILYIYAPSIKSDVYTLVFDIE